MTDPTENRPGQGGFQNSDSDLNSTLCAQVRETAEQWHRNGFVVLPTRSDGTKAPDANWKRYTQEQPTDQQMQEWFGANNRQGLGIVCGSISGGLEMLELEGRAIAEQARKKLVPAFKASEVYDVWRTLVKGYAEWTPSGGLHLLYKIEDHPAPGNTKLASREAHDHELTNQERGLKAKNPDKIIPRVLAETRGEGGFVVVAPSGGTTHPTGKAWAFTKSAEAGAVPTITWAQRNAIFSIITAVLDTVPQPPPRQPQGPRITDSTGTRPGDAWAQVTPWDDVLAPHGWEQVYSRGDDTFWVRPGKSKRDGISARTGGTYDTMWVFSTSTELPAGETMTKLAVYTHLNHGGDYKAAAKALAGDGYGEQSSGRHEQPPPWQPPPPQAEATEEPTGRTGDRGLTFTSLADLCAEVDAEGPRKWLLRGVWPAGDYGIHAAEMKAQKTWNTVDVAVSVASGTPWLGGIEVDTPGPVLMLAGEGSRSNLIRRIRAICATRDLKAEELPITICTRAPHLNDAVHRGQIAEQLLAVKPALVTLDPLYLAARGASGTDLYAMGEVLEGIQHLCQAVNASLWVVHHNNRSTGRSGALRISGAGPAEWGRVLITAEVKKRQKNAVTKETVVTTKLEIIGGEVADQDYTITRTIRSEDPDDLNARLFYAITLDQEADGDEGTPFRPSWLMEEISKALNRGAEMTQTQIVERIGKRKKTVLEALDLLVNEGFVRCETKGRSKAYHSQRQYSQALDPRSDKYAGNPDNTTEWSA